MDNRGRQIRIWLPWGSEGKEPTCNAGDLGPVPGSGRSPEGRHGNPLQNSGLENPHGQRSLVGYSPQDHRIRHNRVTYTYAVYAQQLKVYYQ